MLENGIEAFGLRDDAAVLDLSGGGPLLASVDSVVEGVHFDLSLCSPGDVGWKALMGALSDLAAMGAAPLAALVALCVPGGAGDGELALGVMAGVAEASAAAACPVVGGDVSEGGELMVAVTVLGTVEPGGPRPVSRSGAQPGDAVLRHRTVRRIGGRAARAPGRRRSARRRRDRGRLARPTGARWPRLREGEARPVAPAPTP